MKSLKEYIALPQIYLDMDEVLCGFLIKSDEILQRYGYPKFRDSQWAQLGNTADDVKWAVLDKQKNFWLKLPFTSEGKKLWNFTKLYKPGILSHSEPRMFNCQKEKLQWLETNLGLSNLGTIHISDKREDKMKFAINNNGKPNILIDDYELNCHQFSSAGGIAIHFVKAKDVINQLKLLGFK